MAAFGRGTWLQTFSSKAALFSLVVQLLTQTILDLLFDVLEIFSNCHQLSD
jgi:hypothetical protein